MSIDATFCPVCASTVPTHRIEQHIAETHDPRPDHHVEAFDQGRDDYE